MNRTPNKTELCFYAVLVALFTGVMASLFTIWDAFTTGVSVNELFFVAENVTIIAVWIVFLKSNPRRISTIGGNIIKPIELGSPTCSKQ